jgi:UDP-N-acetylglucosamine 4,6-dehydratase
VLEGNVLVTGGAGFLGRAILRRATREKWPARFTVYSRDETKQWELKHRYPDVQCILGDVCDRERLDALMTGIDYVIHAAAVKYIPEAEHNAEEAVRVNYEGSRAVARAAARQGVKKVVGISTDKACAPLNTYGASKMLMERLFGEANRWADTRFTTVRYGNVVGSTGSVIPLFARQVRETGEITITDPRMTRFWLSVDEAIDLVLVAFAEAEVRPGSTFVGANPAMSIVDLADAVWRSSGRTSAVAVKVIGIRPGEKLHESLFNEQEAPRASWREGPPPGYTLAAATLPAVNEPGIPAGYSSNDPLRWLGAEEMCRLIEDAKSV